MQGKLLARHPAFLYPFALLVVGLTTWLLLGLEAELAHLSHHLVRPYTVVFLIPIAFLTLLGGRRVGIFALLLSGLFAVTVLLSAHITRGMSSPTNITELVLLAVTGTMVILGMDAMRRNVHTLRREQEAQTRLQTVMDTSPIGMVTCDLDGTLQYANAAAERIWGHPMISVGQEDWSQYRMLNPDGSPVQPEQATLGRVLAGEAPSLTREMILEQPSGKRIWVEATSSLMHDPQGQPTGGLVMLQDITERKEAEAANMALRAQAEARAEREALLNRISAIIRSISEPEEILHQVAAAIGEALGLDRCYFAAYEIEQDRVLLGPDWSRPPLASISGEYLISGLRVNRDPKFFAGGVQAVDDTMADGGDAILERLQIRALLRIILRRGSEMSALTAAMAGGPRAWTADEAALLTEVATQTRSALDLAQVRRREQTIAATLQDALRPRLPQDIQGLDLADYYQPALSESSIGGDFFDVFSLNKDIYALVVGDVSGKGLAAASQVATVRNMLRYALYQQADVAAAVTELNRVTSAQGLLTGFVTLFVGVYDAVNCLLRYVSCGHEPGLVRRRDGTSLELDPTGFVLGAADESVYEERRLALETGDVLVLYTDGISEAGRNKMDFWGVSGLSAHLQAMPQETPAREIVARIIDGAMAHAQGDLHDDVCLLVAIVKPRDLSSFGQIHS
jgi:PAS domain S-box-containing protein